MRSLAGKVRNLLKPGSSSDLGSPLAAVPFAVIGVGLTGTDLRRDAVASLGAVRMTGTRIELGASFGRRLEPGAVPATAAAAAELREFCGSRVLVAHLLPLGLAFLARDADAFRPADQRRRAVDTAAVEEWIAKQREPEGRGAGELSLAATARRRGIATGDPRDLLGDAFATAQLLQRQLRDLPALGVRTLGDLLRSGRP